MGTITILEKLIRRVGLISALVLLPLLIGIRVIEIITRSLNTPSSLYNAMEAELFLLFAFLTIGAAFVSDAHVRVDIIYSRLSARCQAWIELFGALFFVLPTACVVLWYGFVMVDLSMASNERSAIALGAQTRWIIVAATPFGFGLFALAVLCRAARSIVFLRGDADSQMTRS